MKLVEFDKFNGGKIKLDLERVEAFSEHLEDHGHEHKWGGTMVYLQSGKFYFINMSYSDFSARLTKALRKNARHRAPR